MVAMDIALYVVTIPTGVGTVLPAYMAIILAGALVALGILSSGLAGGAVIGFLTWAMPGIFVPANTAVQWKAFPWQR